MHDFSPDNSPSSTPSSPASAESAEPDAPQKTRSPAIMRQSCAYALPPHLQTPSSDRSSVSPDVQKVRTFGTGATRTSNDGKPAYDKFLSPLAIHAFGRYMLKHQIQADGTKRAADNWQKGIPLESYIESLFRHVFDLWCHHRGFSTLANESLMEAACATFFNSQGYLHEYVKDLLATGSYKP
jgi:hypothetical protein